MPIPYASLVPLVGIGVGFCAGFEGMRYFVKRETLGKPQRVLTDLWDDQLMQRNEILTGHPYGQMNELYAPEVYSRSDPVYLVHE
ncbi:hypothetical protein HMI54_015826 [Coelomomyces lativittatus]|nr:hypothetical protein HMI54_015826 [Coelomomyces lativittatus]KAJ1513671.1 hypothetical protein HMI56_001988 [Coelomomyces lativittatus]KAJ1515003.1 hypothetical protein HMI55_004126 [Coelomomyces lativittatus]